MADVLTQTVSLLDTNWNTANTGGVKPVIDLIQNHKRLRFSQTAANNGDYVLCYGLPYTQEPSGINTSHINTQEPIVVDIKSMVSRVHVVLLRDEVRRIIGANFVDAFTDTELFDIELIEDKSDKLRKIWQFVCTERAKSFHVAR